MLTNEQLEQRSWVYRRKILQYIKLAGAGHTAGSLSCVDILVAAYWAALDVNPAEPSDPDRDRMILSKGHAAAALYATLPLAVRLARPKPTKPQRYLAVAIDVAPAIPVFSATRLFPSTRSSASCGSL